MTFNKTLQTATLLALGGFAAMSGANAAETDTFNVSMTIQKTCDIAAGGNADITFGPETGSITGIEGQSTTGIAVNCTNSTPYTLALSTTAGPTDGTGVMLGGNASAEQIPYTLYSDASFSTVWGAQTELTANTVTGTGDGMSTLATQHLVYAKTGDADVSAGTYTDSVTVNVTY